MHTNVCVDNSYVNVHPGIHVGHMIPHAQLACSVATLASLSGDLHSCLRKAQRGSGVHCVQLADTCLVMQWCDPLSDRNHWLLGVRSVTRLENRASARRCSYLSMLLYSCCEKSGDDHSAPHVCKECGGYCFTQCKGGREHTLHAVY